MPFEVIDMLDPLTPLIELRASAVYELLMSVHTLLKPARRHETWAKHTISLIAPDLLQELTQLYEPFANGNIYLELPVDYTNHRDVPGFFEYVRQLSDTDFVFYLVGRTIPRGELQHLIPDLAAIRKALSAGDEHYQWYGEYLEPVLADIAGFRDRLVDAWEGYWTSFFQYEIPSFEPMWAAGLQEKTTILEREGGRVLYEKVTGKTKLPIELPPDIPLSSITFRPVYMLPSRVYLFFGYGNITVLFDPQYTEERRIAIEQATQEAMATIKALDDETRLKILQLIAQHGGNYHGKTIAERLGKTASAVSRHLALLREGNLITEEPHENLIRYTFQKETLLTLVDKLMDYLYS